MTANVTASVRRARPASKAERALIAAQQARLEADAREAERIAEEKQRIATAEQELSLRELDCRNRIRAIIDRAPITFPTARAALRRKARRQLREVVPIAQSCPTVRFVIEGHTDDRGDEFTNLWLSKQRAKTVVDFLVRRGVAEARIRSAGFGETRPIASNANADGRGQNRRIDLTVERSVNN